MESSNNQHEQSQRLCEELGNEIILGCDIFDTDDIWRVLCTLSLDDLRELEKHVREYIYKKWPREDAVRHGIWSEEFLARQMDTWIYQYKWRYVQTCVQTDNRN